MDQLAPEAAPRGDVVSARQRVPQPPEDADPPNIPFEVNERRAQTENTDLLRCLRSL
jgi:hypothetical protein